MASVVWNSTAETAGDIHDSGSDFSVCINALPSSFLKFNLNCNAEIGRVSLLRQ
jgi:hypothetical protein